MSVTEAAQAVQISAFPNAYAKWEPLARALVAQFGGGAIPGGDGDHANGRAIDAMLPYGNYKSTEAKAFGWKVANWPLDAVRVWSQWKRS
jgi:hypothetical protein